MSRLRSGLVFFSRRRRHTRCGRDWSSDVCSSDLGGHSERSIAIGTIEVAVWDAVAKIAQQPLHRLLAERFNGGRVAQKVRSEERRVGKRCRSAGLPLQLTKNVR